jgi:hypothetical protein
VDIIASENSKRNTSSEVESDHVGEAAALRDLDQGIRIASIFVGNIIRWSVFEEKVDGELL